MTNPQSGETDIEIDAQRYRLRLSLAALAEIEHRLDVNGLEALSNRLKALGAQDLLKVLTALLRAGGAEEADQLAVQADPAQAVQAVSACFRLNLS